MLHISTAELAAKAEETRGQLRHLDQQVGPCVCVCVNHMAMSAQNISDEDVLLPPAEP